MHYEISPTFILFISCPLKRPDFLTKSQFIFLNVSILFLPLSLMVGTENYEVCYLFYAGFLGVFYFLTIGRGFFPGC